MTVFGLNPDYKSTLDKSNKHTFVNSLYLYGLLAKENAFDVIIIDEASQSDVSSLAIHYFSQHTPISRPFHHLNVFIQPDLP